MLNETQRKQITTYVDNFKSQAHTYLDQKSCLERLLSEIDLKEKEFYNVAKEERQIAAAMEVLYGQSKEEDRISEMANTERA